MIKRCILKKAEEIQAKLNSLIFAILFLLLFLFSCNSKNEKFLNQKEQEWLQNRNDKIDVLFGYYSPPDVFIDKQGVQKGVLVDFFYEIESLLGNYFVVKNFSTWSDLVEYSKVNDNFIIVGIKRTEERTNFLSFTNYFTTTPNVVITKNTYNYTNIENLDTARVCVPANYAITDDIRRGYPTINLIFYEGDLACLRAVASGECDATITSEMYASYIIQERGIPNLKIRDEFHFTGGLSVGVSKRDPMLFSIMSKTINQISPDKRVEIYKRWINISSHKISRKVIVIIFISFGIILLLLLLFWLISYSLRKQVKKQTKQIIDSESKYRAIIENSNDAIFLLKENGFELVNKQFVELFNCTYQEVKQSSFDILNFVLPEDQERIANLIKPSEFRLLPSLNTAFKIASKNNEIKFIDVSLSYIRHNNQWALQGIIHDVTEQKNNEKELILSKNKAEESDRLKSIFLANISHEIRTPMNGILGFSELLMKPLLSAEKQSMYLNIIKKSGKRMLSTINDIVDISKIEANQVDISNSVIDLKEIINSLFLFFKEETDKKGLSFIVKHPNDGTSTTIYSDYEKLYAVFTNLIKNAIKYTNEGKIEVSYRLEGSFFKCFVLDTGIGIKMDRQKAIFDRFVQADLTITKEYEGSGLGLSISKAYVEMLGGKIEVKSSIGKGALFAFSIAANQEKKALLKPIKATKPIKDFKFNNTVILIAEDDLATRLYFSELLTNSCKKIYFAENGEEAIQICKKNSDINLVLLDLKMPKKNGYQVFYELKKIRPNLPIIAQTAYAMHTDIFKIKKTGFDDYITKPINKDKLFSLIEYYGRCFIS